jgi:hypothetical protein
MADFRHDYVKEHLKDLTLEERLEGISPEELLQQMSPEERLRGLPPEDRLKGLSPAEIEHFLEELRRDPAAQPRKRRRKH